MRGIDKFRNHFADYADSYAVIGGAACQLLLENSPVHARATKDIDVILFVEALSAKFFTTFWCFIENGGYKVRARVDGSPILFQFRDPDDLSYPIMIELFSRDNSLLDEFSQSHIIPLLAPDDLSNLSSILLDEDYYALAKAGGTIVNGVSTLAVEEIILFKVKAFLDLTKRRESGEAIDTDDIKKHRTDIIRLASTLSQREYALESERIKDDLREFLDRFESSAGELRSLKVPVRNPDLIVQTLRVVFGIG